MLLCLLNWIGGLYNICGNRMDSAALLNLCMNRGFQYWNLTYDDACFFLHVRKKTWKNLFHEATANGIYLTVLSEHGLPYFLYRYRKRWGLIVGILLCSLTVFISGKFVWRIEVRGIEQYHTRDVLDELTAHGFGIGSYIPRIDVNALQNQVLMNSKKFAWLSVNLIGTTARVEVIETSPKPEKERNNSPMNLVASADGRIVRFSLRSGWESVEAGDVVRKGELLVSGIGERKDGGTQLVCAAGQVYAEVIHELKVEIPLQYNRKVFESPQKAEKSINFFGKEIKLFEKTGIYGGSCDTIYSERILSFFGSITVPVIFCTKTILPYSTETALHTPEQALVLAEAALRQKIDALSDDRELLRQTKTVTVTDTSLQLNCTLACIENIALAEPIILGSPNITSEKGK